MFLLQSVKEVSLKLPSAEVLNSITSVSIETWLALVGLGQLWLALVGFGWPWSALVGFGCHGWLWSALVGFDWL